MLSSLIYIYLCPNGFKGINPIPVHLFKYINSFKVSLSDDEIIELSCLRSRFKSVPLKISDC